MLHMISAENSKKCVLIILSLYGIEKKSEALIDQDEHSPPMTLNRTEIPVLNPGALNRSFICIKPLISLKWSASFKVHQ